jgi:hypothetical protein
MQVIFFRSAREWWIGASILMAFSRYQVTTIEADTAPMFRFSVLERLRRPLPLSRTRAVTSIFELWMRTSLIGVKGKKLTAYFAAWWRGKEGQIADRDQLHLSDVILEEVPSGEPDCGRVLRPMLDQLANAAGFEASPNFDENGNYTIR